MQKKKSRGSTKEEGPSFQALVQTEKSLTEQMLTLRTVIDSLSEGVIVAGVDGKFLLFNPVAEKILGIGSREVDPVLWTQIYGCYRMDQVTPFPPEELPLARAIHGEQVDNEILYIKNPKKPDGVFISISASPLRNSRDELMGGIIIFRDITENVRAEEFLRKSEMRLSAQFKWIPIPTYVWEWRNGTFYLIDYNYAAHDITNGLIKKFLGKKISYIFKNRPILVDDMTRCLREKSVITRELPHKMRTTGEHKQVIFTFVHVPDNLILLHMQDITELKRKEKELIKLSSAMQQTADSVLITDKKGLIEYVNPGFTETTGYQPEEVLGQSPRLLKSGTHDIQFYRKLWRTIRDGRTFRGTIVNRKKSGELYWAEQTITPMKDSVGSITHYVSVLKDITDFKLRQEQEFNLQLARQVQKRLYQNKVTLPGFDLAGDTYSADAANGDYFDFIRLADGSIGLVIGDVSGHGVSAAFIMSETRAFLRAFAQTESDPGRLLTLLNAELVRDLDEARFVTMILARIDPEKRVLSYASAGHEPAFVLNRHGKIKSTLVSLGIPLGFIREFTYQTSELIQLGVGDAVIFLTDGVTEARISDDGAYGTERAIDLVRKYRHESSRQILDRLYTAVQNHTAGQPQQDDITAIICRVTSSSKPMTARARKAGSIRKTEESPNRRSCLIDARSEGRCEWCEEPAQKEYTNIEN